jgi:hypothetical protein
MEAFSARLHEEIDLDTLSAEQDNDLQRWCGRDRYRYL